MIWIEKIFRRLSGAVPAAESRQAIAAPLLGAAINPTGYFERACRLKEGGKLQEALAVAEQVTIASPDWAEPWQLGFDLLVALRNEHEAVDWGLKAIRLLGDTVTPRFLGNIGAAARQSGRLDDADSILSHALTRYPANPVLLGELGWTYLKRRQFQRALQFFRSAQEAAPNWPMPRCGAAAALRRLSADDEANAELDSLIASHPDDLSVLLTVAQDHKELGLIDRAIDSLLTAKALFPNRVEPLVNLGPLLARKGDTQGALASLDAALAIDPYCAPAHMNISLPLLALGRFAEGWRHYQYRHRILLKRNYVTQLCPGDPTVRLPEDLLPVDFSGKKITLVEDQGLGDELSFLRFASCLRERGARTVYMPDPRLANMVARSGIVDCVAAPGEDAPQDADILLACGDLPLLLGHHDAADIPPPFRLAPLDQACTEIRGRLASLRARERPLIGLTWRAGHFNKPDGALFKETPLEAIALLLRDLDVEILCLQRQPAQDELDTLERILERPVADFSSLNQDLESMLALLDELDDYVAVSNTNVHLRAGLGKTARVLVPFPADYRWMASGDESPWFRGFRIYRQAVGGSWDNALATLQTDLWQAFSGHAPPPSAIPESWPEPTQRTAPQEPALRSYKIGKSNDLLPKVGKVNFVTIDSFAERDGRLTAELASTRYRVLLPGEQLARRGFGVRIFPRPEGGWRPDDAARFPEGAVVFSKSFSADNVSLAKELKERGHPVIVDICDNHFDHPSFGTDLRALCETATRIVVNTEAMAKAVEKATGGASLIVGDPLEGPRGIPAFAPRIPAIKILWFGHPTNLDSLAKALPQLAEAAGRHPIDLTILTRPDPAVGKLVTTISANPPAALSARSLAWSEAETWRQLELCDLVIIPSLEDDRRLVKSPNRLLETIWAGRLAVAHPLPSYQAFSDYCCLTEDIADGIAWAIDNQAVALDRVRAGQDAIALECSAWRIAADWEAAVYGNSSDRPLKLNLGCGDKILPDYLNVDIAPTRRGNRPDVMCDLRHLSMFPSDIADEILSVHVVEHFSRWEVEQVLAEWLRVLKPGGRMVIECPNLASACRAFLDDPRAAGGPGREGQRTMWVFYGDPAWKDPLMNHRWGYSPESLAELLEGAGLGNVRVEPAQFKLREPRDMRLVGEKPGGSADRGNATAGHGDNEPPPAMSAGAAADRASQTSRPLQPVAPRQAWDDYFVWFHETGVWKRLNYHGIRTLKFPPDMWNYQELIFEEDIDWVIETGTRHGGSALFFADTLAARQAPGRVISVDIDAGARQVRDDPRITFLVGDSGSARLAAEVEALLPADRGPLFLILDSDHAKQHVLRELAAWVPLLRSGDYLVVEDTCVNGHPARPDHGPGPMEAIREWLGSDRSGKLQADEARSRKFGATAAPNGYFKIK